MKQQKDAAGIAADAGNRLDALAAVAGSDPLEIASEIKAAAESLRSIACRHLEASR